MSAVQRVRPDDLIAELKTQHPDGVSGETARLEMERAGFEVEYLLNTTFVHNKVQPHGQRVQESHAGIDFLRC